MIIREVKAEDAESILALMLQLDSETKFMMLEPGERQTTLEQQAQILQSFHDSASKAMFILVDNNEAYGYIEGIGGTANRIRHSLHIVIGLRQAAASKGYGRQLFDHLETWAKSRHFTRMDLTVMCHNERAVKLYTSCGFEIEGTKRNSLYIGEQYVDEYYMSKLLSAS